ncbi:Uncharacterised protein [Delftia tsuruhatensis]|uniref:DUF4349 domain-containing protein n=1 Tax=Delftia tsuruhatensis TaxID=180282 RepID=UPI001E7EA186|nr:DUF4349 domain-containing protein [Delftia tsuruhatensis]CAB5714676.1 Uncharacterised protein [Delftia tsuruhatensis]CAC9689167.1 Uncharacterised protein [Delftia tsuruhatensis]
MTHPRLSILSSRMAVPALLVLAATLALAGCNQRHDTASMEPASAPAPMASGASMKQGRAAVQAEIQVEAQDAAAAPPAKDEVAQRYLAVRQELNVEVPQARLADAWGQVRDQCATLRCELLSASLLRETPQQPGHAQLEMRVAPADVDRLLGTLAGVASIVSQNTLSEDKTAEVIDVEARIRNRTEFRDSLRLMLRDTTTKRTMSDLLEIQRTLSDTQAELDAMAAQRKVLEQQTSKQHIQIQFSPTRTLVQGGSSYSPIGRALREAGDVLAESVAALITFAAAVLPWLLLVVLPLGWITRVLWRRRRARKA